jgi:hypothetical protein
VPQPGEKQMDTIRQSTVLVSNADTVCVPRITRHIGLLFLTLFIALSVVGCESNPCGKDAGEILDEALCVGRNAESLPGSADTSYLADMDYGESKDSAFVHARLAPYFPGITPAQAVDAYNIGRNNWVMWSGGNDLFWDRMAGDSYGNLDLLKTITNDPKKTTDDPDMHSYSRDNRWKYFGIVNEPCYEKGHRPTGEPGHSNRYGLYIDRRQDSCTDPFEDETAYPGIEIGSRGKDIGAPQPHPVGSYYGYGTGIVGLRLFPNPDFDKKAYKRWDPERYFTDKEYYENKNLVKPYRVGMSCGFCHIGPNPTNPPADFEKPAWANLNSNPGAQYLQIDRTLLWKPDVTNFASQLFHTYRPGALDTSMIASDYVNNPRTMNALYNVGPRMTNAARRGRASLQGDERGNMQFNRVAVVPSASPLQQFFNPANYTVQTPRVLKDGADSVGVLGALNRVYVNIGLFGEEWVQHFFPLVGGTKVTPFEISVARKNSSYWNATEAQTPYVAAFFLASARPDKLATAPEGERYLTGDQATLRLGKEVFAEDCAACHSSKLPSRIEEYFPEHGCAGENYLECFNTYWKWTHTDEFKSEMRKIVLAEDFLENNFLSTELRVPVTVTETNACSPLAGNAIEGKIWDNFSSDTYKKLPAVGAIRIQDPFNEVVSEYTMPAGGRGYTRPASLVSVWTSAPFLLNNTLGEYNGDATVAGRMGAFDNAITQLLWPEKRKGDFSVVTRSGRKHPGIIDRTEVKSYLRAPTGFLPYVVQNLDPWPKVMLPWLFDDKGLRIGPIPADVPINLLSNINLDHDNVLARLDLLNVLWQVKKDVQALPDNPSGDQLRVAFAPLIAESKCPDYVVNRGHYFGTDFTPHGDGLDDAQKLALIEFLKTL